MVKGSYGFIKRDRERNDKTANESRIFFHLSEMLDANAKTGRRRVKKGCEVEFTVLEVSDKITSCMACQRSELTF